MDEYRHVYNSGVDQLRSELDGLRTVLAARERENADQFMAIERLSRENAELKKQVEWCCWASECPKSHENMVKLQSENTTKEAACAEMREALSQARGALLLDHMVDDDGQPFGTTTVALEAIEAATHKNPAGREYAARMKRLEAVVEAANRGLVKHCNAAEALKGNCMSLICPMKELCKALATLVVTPE